MGNPVNLCVSSQKVPGLTFSPNLSNEIHYRLSKVKICSNISNYDNNNHHNNISNDNKSDIVIFISNNNSSNEYRPIS